MESIILKSDHIFVDQQWQPGAIRIENGIIQDVILGESGFGNEKMHDYSSYYIMPGCIDPHVHFNEPGRTEWEGFTTGTQAAVAGGVTTVVEMPLNAKPVTINVEALKEKTAFAREKLWCHCGFWGGITPKSMHEWRAVINHGILGFKVFLIDSGIADFEPLSFKDLKEVLPELERWHLPLLVHAEKDLQELSGPNTFSSPEDVARELAWIQEGSDQLSKNPGSYPAFLKTRPERMEWEAIYGLIKLQEEIPAQIHIVHVSSEKSLNLIREAKSRGLPLTAETCPHYLYFEQESLQNGNSLQKCMPPIRSRDNNKGLWKALEEGTLDYVASDHSPTTPELKLLGHDNIKEAWGGINGVQYTLPVINTLLQRKNMDLSHLPLWLCQKPARFLGLAQKKGTIAPGYDADLVIWDPFEKTLTSREYSFSKYPLSPYIGEDLKGQVYCTYVQGEKAFDQNKFTNKPNGRILRSPLVRMS